MQQEELDQVKAKMTGIIEQMEGHLITMDDWGRRRLAYPVNKQLRGFYIQIDYSGQPAMMAELERNMRIEEDVWKYLTLVKDKEYSEEKYQAEMDRLNAEAAARRREEEAERAAREAARETEAGASAEPVQATPPEEPAEEPSEEPIEAASTEEPSEEPIEAASTEEPAGEPIEAASTEEPAEDDTVA